MPASGDAYGLQRWHAWSSNGDRLAFVTDIDNDGDDDVVIANKDGETLQTFDFGQVSDVTLSWSPDDTKLAVTTNVKPIAGAPNSTTRGRLITLASGAIVDFALPVAGNNFVKSKFEWSPNSRYFVHGYLTDATSYFSDTVNLIDTQNPASSNVSAFAYYAEWTTDSRYVALAVRPADATRYGPCTASVIDTSTSNHAIAPVGQNTTCALYWSYPGKL